MFKLRTVLVFATVAALGTGCAHFSQGYQAGDVIDPADASKTAVLHVDNLSNSPIELRTITTGRSQFVGSVGPNDSTSVLLDPTLFPTGSLYISAIAADGTGRAVVGPLAAGKGDKIKFTVEPALDQSHAIVTR
jgi:hypothetical protein